MAGIDTDKNYLELSIEAATATNTIMITSISILGVVSVTYFIFMIYLGVYAYGNPDPKSAFYVDGVDSTALTR